MGKNETERCKIERLARFIEQESRLPGRLDDAEERLPVPPELSELLF